MSVHESLPVCDIRSTGGACGCSDDGEPELDVRAIPHAIRQATVFSALAAVPAGGSLRLIAPHEQEPLLAQIEDREGGTIGADYLVRGPHAWTLRLTRQPDLSSDATF
ncbi:DUF2249 domain-containing protein [Terrabacter sp. Ter38]|uniref:DUF2249 domain-containing protein n=1 Tax=Terrabacter sp. Ter38 TaxID=2926030 RepID=UPI002117415D|nr:DUF2249 domain-containing protein [Terrabacter sp. Ter38]